MLAEGRVGNHLTQEVEVRGHQRHDAAADKHGQVLFVVKSHFLHKPVAKTVNEDKPAARLQFLVVEASELPAYTRYSLTAVEVYFPFNLCAGL